MLLIALSTCVWWLTKRPDGWAAYQLAKVILLLSVDVPGEPLASWIRHLVVLPPFFVALASAALQPRWKLLGIAAGAVG